MGTDVPWFKEGLGDLRGLDTLEKLAKVALGDGETPGVDRAAVDALLSTTSTRAGETGLKIGKLAELFSPRCRSRSRAGRR